MVDTALTATFFADGLDDGAKVAALRAHEALSRPSEARVEIEMPAGAWVETRGWLGRAAAVVLSAGGEAPLRRIGGFVTSVRERVARADGRQRVVVTLGSPLAALETSRDRRSFLDLDSRAIVEQLLADHGVPASAYAFRLRGTPPRRASCLQIGETAYAFASRILAEDGIFHHVEQTEDGPVVVFGDSPSAYGDADAPRRVVVRSGGMAGGATAIAELAQIATARPAKVVLRDHDFTRPALDLESAHEDDAPLAREHYDYPGRYVEPDVGAARARALLEGLDAASRGLRGRGDVVELAAGHVITVEGAPDASMDGSWVVREVTLDVEDRSGAVRAEVSFELAPADLAVRPALAPPPKVEGLQVARVTGPAGEEIHCDEHGRVKVSFPWDRRSTDDEHASAWVRVAQLHTSGSCVIPRIGWEVLVDFEDGDPDRPIVLGRLYNGIYKPPYPLPASKKTSSFQSMSTPGGGGQNELRMDDSAGAEAMSWRAQKDMNVVVANHKTEKVGNRESVSVGVNHDLAVGGNQSITIGSALSLNVGSSQTLDVGGSRTKTIGKGETVSIGGSRTTTIGGSHVTLTPQNVALTTSGTSSETIGGSAIDVAALEVATAIAGAASLSVGGARLSLCGADRSDTVIGAKATNVGGASIAVAGGDASVACKGAKATNVGGAWMLNAADTCDISSGSSLSINVGGAFLLNAAKIVLKVGGSSVTIAGGQVKLDSAKVILEATGPHLELAAVVSDK